jgi:ABC-2 type transport system ATP-binding protein
VTLEGLTKRYGKRVAVDHLTLEIPAGVVAGFVGPNGAGKTTTMAMLLGLVTPSAGSGTVLGHSLGRPQDYLSRVGALIEGPGFYPGLTGAENLTVLATLGGHDPARIPEVLERVGLDGRGHDRFREYSTGMKQRLGIAGALLGDPDLLVLDEPANGLDPAGIHEMRGLVASLRQASRTVLVSSHILSELEQVCDWLVVIDEGSLVYDGPAAGFLDQAPTVVCLVPEHDFDLERLRGLLLARGHQLERTDGEVLVHADGTDARKLAAELNRSAQEEGIVLAGLHARRPNLESHYLSVIRGGDR